MYTAAFRPASERGGTVPGTPNQPGAAMAGYWVTPDDLSSAATFVDGRASDINTKIQALGTYVNGLGDFWQGPAHQAFDTLMADYHIYADMLNNALTDIAKGLRGNYVNYQSTEQTNLANIVKVELPPPNHIELPPARF